MANDTREDALDALFAQARDGAPDPGLVARVLSDAGTVQAELGAAPVRPARPAAPRRGWLAELRDALGGWPGLSGVTAAGIVGLGLGFYAPDLVDGVSGGQIWNLSGGAGATPEIGSLWTEDGDV